jgi:hypothetical protein
MLLSKRSALIKSVRCKREVGKEKGDHTYPMLPQCRGVVAEVEDTSLIVDKELVRRLLSPKQGLLSTPTKFIFSRYQYDYRNI